MWKGSYISGMTILYKVFIFHLYHLHLKWRCSCYTCQVQWTSKTWLVTLESTKSLYTCSCPHKHACEVLHFAYDCSRIMLESRYISLKDKVLIFSLCVHVIWFISVLNILAFVFDHIWSNSVTSMYREKTMVENHLHQHCILGRVLDVFWWD